jgi:hypothetical protein
MFRPATKIIRGDIRSETYSMIYAPEVQRNICRFSCNTIFTDILILTANTVATHSVTNEKYGRRKFQVSVTIFLLHKILIFERHLFEPLPCILTFLLTYLLSYSMEYSVS